MVRSKIVGTGAYLPDKVVTNFDLSENIDTSDEWIFSRTGIKKRHIARDDEFTSDMALEACKRAVLDAGVDIGDIDLIVVATTTPDVVFPSTSVIMQSKIGAKNAVAFDIQAVCSGFVYALAVADNFLKSGQAKTALVVGADKMSSIIDWQDRSTCVLFGDGAGAVVLASSRQDVGILSTSIYSDGDYGNILRVDGGVANKGGDMYIKMSGKEVFKHASEKMVSSVHEVLKQNNLTTDQIDWLIPHQANMRILDMVAKKLSIDGKKVVSTVKDHANTSAASIPLALDELNRSGSIESGDYVVMTALGGGLTWGAVAIKW